MLMIQQTEASFLHADCTTSVWIMHLVSDFPESLELFLCLMHAALSKSHDTQLVQQKIILCLLQAFVCWLAGVRQSFLP